MSNHEKQKALSKKWLSNSLIELMKVKPYGDITISEIAANADLSRRTFYRAFKSKEEVITCIVENLVSEYTAELMTPIRLDMESMSRAFFGFFEKHREIVLIFRQNRLEYFILESFNKYLPQIRTQACNDKISDDPKVEKMFTLMSGGAFFNMLMYWSENDSDLTVQELSQLIPKAVEIFSRYNSQ